MQDELMTNPIDEANGLLNANALDIEAIIAEMRAAGRQELVHYAGAAHRDPVAWFMVRVWIHARWKTESQLKEWALREALAANAAAS